MANSYTRYNGDGTNKQFAVPFQYISRDDVDVFVGGTEVTFTWLNASLIETTAAPTVGVGNVLIKRSTPSVDPAVVFASPSNFVPDDLNLAFRQLLFVSQEAFDTLDLTLPEDLADGTYDAQGRRIKSAADPINDQDVVTKLWAMTSMSSALGEALAAKVAAQASASAASASNTSAATHDANALASANDAASSASAADTSEGHASTSASGAASSASAASASAASAAISASSASSSSASASTDAASALSSKNAAATSASSAGTSATNAASSATAAAQSAVDAANAAGGGVQSFAGRAGTVVPAADDYAASQITNDSAVDGSSIKEALDSLATILATAIKFKGDWNASAGTFPGSGSAKLGWQYKVSVAGTVGGVSFSVGDDVYATIDNASTSTYAGNWVKIEGTITAAEVGAALGYTPANDSVVAKTAGNQTLTGGFKETPYSAGTKSSGTFTPDAANGNQQYATNGGAHVLAPPAAASSIVLEYVNNGSAGAITTPSFTKVTGDSFTTTNANKFVCFITKTQNSSHLHVVALQ